jgi:hypothetical protein
MHDKKAGMPTSVEWVGDDIFIYTDKNWIYKMENGESVPIVTVIGD